MATTATAGGELETRHARACEEHMTLTLVPGIDGWIVEGESGTAHVVAVEDEQAHDCTCPDATHRDKTCKHQIAVNEWEIDRLVRAEEGALDL